MTWEGAMRRLGNDLRCDGERGWRSNDLVFAAIINAGGDYMLYGMLSIYVL